MELIFYLFSNLFHIYAVYQCSSTFFQKEHHLRWREILCYLGYYALNSGVYLLFHNGILNILSNLIPYFCITLLYRTSWMQRILATVSIYIMSMIADIVCTTATVWMDSPPIFFTSGFVPSLLLLVFARTIQHFRLFGNVSTPKLKMFYLLTTIFVPLGCIVVAHFVARTLSWQSLLSAIILLMINISVFSLYDLLIRMMEEHHTAQMIQKQNQAYRAQLEVIQQSQMRLRCLRHDMKNHLFQMQRLLEEGDLEQLGEYLNTTKSFLYSGDWEPYTENEAVNSILNYKLSPLRQTPAKVEVKVELPEKFAFQVFDLNVILGNLLDNAVEASSHMQPEEQHIRLRMKAEKGILRICVGNRFDGVLPKQGTTRKADTENHGIGLKSVEEIVQKYHGKLRTETEDNWYEVFILLYEESGCP
ncbi:MAG: sensor histidine kinase [Ruminococcus sp.]